MIRKKLIHFNTKSEFNAKKISANPENTQYQLGGTGAVQSGEPDVMYQAIVYIKDTMEQWTHGKLYPLNKSDQGAVGPQGPYTCPTAR